MNVFIGVGKIVDANLNNKVLNFNLAILQEKPCVIPCVIFDPSDDVQNRIGMLQRTEKVVSLQGRLSSYEFESKGRAIRKVNIVAYPGSIKTIL